MSQILSLQDHYVSITYRCLFLPLRVSSRYFCVDAIKMLMLLYKLSYSNSHLHRRGAIYLFAVHPDDSNTSVHLNIHHSQQAKFVPLRCALHPGRYCKSCINLHFIQLSTAFFRSRDISVPENTSQSVQATIVLWLGLLLPPLWFSISVVTSWSTGAFRNSGYCKGHDSVSAYLGFLVISSVVWVDIMGRRDAIDDIQKRYATWLGVVVLFLELFFYVVRNREQIVHDWRQHRRRLINEDLWYGGVQRRHRLFRRYLLLAWYVPKVCW
jgi:hypothetical protein